MRVMQHLWSLAALALAVGACAKEQTESAKQDSAAPAMVGSAEYTVVLKSTWTPANHPFEYPKANPLTGPHFSGLIGASHNETYSIFQEGGLPTPGLERLSEEGKHTPLDEEIKAAIASDKAGMLFETGALRDFNDSLVTTVRVDDAHSLISLVAMVAPSPDWFTGVANVNLMENGAWAASRTLDLVAYDSGGDDGTTYKAADRDNNPKKPTAKAATPHFVVNGVTVPVGRVTFTKK
jgi:hypothetical protein